MLLSEKDIELLEMKGFVKSHFAKFDRQGYALLKNRDGYCVFYDLSKKRCSVYSDRPLGCRVYPVILDEEEGIVFDDICDSCETISEKEKTYKGKTVVDLLKRIDAEAQKRRS
jgi:Fe-S-cluster containining protein